MNTIAEKLQEIKNLQEEVLEELDEYYRSLGDYQVYLVEELFEGKENCKIWEVGYWEDNAGELVFYAIAYIDENGNLVTDEIVVDRY